jgi:hypothetical protein
MQLPYSSDSKKSTPKRDRSHTAVRDKKTNQNIRKANQRAREAKDQRKRFEIILASEVIEMLRKAGILAGGNAKEQAEWLLRGLAQKNLDDLTSLSERAAIAWGKAKPYLPYMSYLMRAGSKIRAKGMIFTHEDWMPIYHEMSVIQSALSQRKWDMKRTEAFMRNAAARRRKVGL